MPLHINIEDLISSKSVESDRIEFKSGWNPDTIYRTICAFANDFDNLGGGYILIGVEEKNGVAIRPVTGLSGSEIANIQQKMIGFNTLINPTYNPKLFIEEIDNSQIIVLWIPGGSNRPYEVPDFVTNKKSPYNYRIRRYASSVVPTLEEKHELIDLANQVPFDDRPNVHSKISDIDRILLRDHLRRTNSRLSDDAEKLETKELLEQLFLLDGPPEMCYPRNVALMLFSEKPEKFFPETFIEIVHFPYGPGDAAFFEAPTITGPVQFQLSHAIDYLKINILNEKVIKLSDRPESLRIWNYPLQVIEEAVVNAIYHRDYQVREPVKIKVYPNSILITNSGGPDRSIRMSDLNSGVVRPKRYRNRRLGGFLKELKLTEGHATGILTMRNLLMQNGSPEPVFNTDDERTWFEAEIFIHPAFFEPREEQKLVQNSDFLILSRVIKKIMNIDDYSNKIMFLEQFIDGTYDSAYDNNSNYDGNYDGNYDEVNIGKTAFSQQMKMSKILISLLNGEKRLEELLTLVGVSTQTKNAKAYVAPLEESGLISKTIPDKPRSKNQKYKLTDQANRLLTKIRQKIT